MEPRIQYAKTKDGVSIAFSTHGEGRPFVGMVGPPFSHVSLDRQRWYERMGRGKMLIRYDPRGTGLSERKVTDYSLDGYLLDLEAVVEHLGLERFALFAMHMAGMVAVSYAARHPERVSHLILWCSFARGADFFESPQVQGLLALADKDWELYTETLAHARMGWPAGEEARQAAEFMREATTSEVFRACCTELGGSDVTSLLPQVKSPTLVLYRRQVQQPPVALAQGLASRIPGARLTVLEGTSLYLSVGDSQSVVEAIDEFLGEGEQEAKPELPAGTAIILFADIVDSTGLTEQLGDAAFRAKARELDTSLRSVIKESGGTPVEGKVLGDGVLAVFTSARQAIDCALRCNANSEPLELQLHLGIHAGDVIREGNNVYGGAVNIAARIATVSAPGEVLISDIVRGLARTSANVTFDDRGEHDLKGVADPQRLYAARWGERG